MREKPTDLADVVSFSEATLDSDMRLIMNNKPNKISKSGRWAVYILECSDKSLYTGITTHLEKRITCHENGSGARYTRGRGPFKLIYTVICADRSEATKKELFIKALTRTEKLAFIKAQSHI